MYEIAPRRGRPTLDIPVSLRISDIAHILQVSESTVKRRITQFGLESNLRTEISDSDLDIITADFVHHFPNSGQNSYDGYLRGKGIKIQRYRVRESLSRVDPMGVQRRLRRALHRRMYSVPMPNSLWHIDGYHKLIRWRIIVHGGIDGFSRLPVFYELLLIIDLKLYSSAFLMLSLVTAYHHVFGVIKR